MPDITKCSPTKIMKKCQTCYRFTSKPDQWQSYSNFLEDCKANEWRNYMEERC